MIFRNSIVVPFFFSSSFDICDYGDTQKVKSRTGRTNE